MGVLRHILTIVGGYLTAKFAFDANMIDGAVSAVVALVGIAWSIVSKTPFEAATPAPAASASAPLALLAEPLAMPGMASGKAKYGLRKDGTPKKRPGRKAAKK